MLATESSFHRAVERLDSILGIHVPWIAPKGSKCVWENRLPWCSTICPSIDRATEAEILVQTSDNKGIPMVRPPAKVEPLGAQADRKGPVPDRKQMACMAGVYTVAKNLRHAPKIVDACSESPGLRKKNVLIRHPEPALLRVDDPYEQARRDHRSNRREQAQQWMTANTIRRHKPHQAMS